MNCQETKPSPSREALDFEHAVVAEFAFLATTYGFACVERSTTRVRFESETVFVNVYHGRASYELGVEIGLIDADEDERLRLPDLVAAMIGEHDDPPKAVYQASEAPAVRRCVAKLATLVREHCSSFLRGDVGAFDKAARMAEARNRELTERYAFGPLRREAETLWRQKRYAEAAQLYEKFADHWTSVERARVAFAKKRT